MDASLLNECLIGFFPPGSYGCVAAAGCRHRQALTTKSGRQIKMLYDSKPVPSRAPSRPSSRPSTSRLHHDSHGTAWTLSGKATVRGLAAALAVLSHEGDECLIVRAAEGAFGQRLLLVVDAD